MNSDEAKQILFLYRPGTADAADPDFAEALRQCERDPGLKRWFDDHCAVYTLLRARFREMPVPEGLKQQILAERKIRTTPLQRRPALLAAAAAVVVLLALFAGWLALRPGPDSSYVNRMVSAALGNYGMIETNNAEQIRAFLTQAQAPADYVLPAPLQRTAFTGCGIEVWRGSSVSILCFNSGRTVGAKPVTDLWLFVADRSAVPDAPASRTPLLAPKSRVMTASWSEGNRTYLLVADGDEAFIRRFL